MKKKIIKIELTEFNRDFVIGGLMDMCKILKDETENKFCSPDYPETNRDYCITTVNNILAVLGFNK
jgi:hypothetical protein